MDLTNKQIVSCSDPKARELVSKAIDSHGYDQPTQMAIWKAVSSCKAKHRTFMKNKRKKDNDERLATFLQETFQLPKKSEKIATAIKQASASSSVCDCPLMHAAHVESRQSLGHEISTLKDELQQSSAEILNQKEQKKQVEDKLSAENSENSNLKRKLEIHSAASSGQKKRKLKCEQQISEYRKTNRILQNTNTTLQRRINCLELKQKECRAELKRTCSQVAYYKKVANKFHTQIKQHNKNKKGNCQCDQLEKKLTKLGEENKKTD